MTRNRQFYLYWLLVNPIGFTLGSLHGATDEGFIPTAIPGAIGLILGDLVFGAMIGLAQWIVFRLVALLPASIWWTFTTSIGFMLGARIGAALTFRITDNWWLAGIVFGIFMGGSIGLATAVIMPKPISLKRTIQWVIISILAWVAGESIAFASFFSQKTVPIVAGAIAAVTGLGLINLYPTHKMETSFPSRAPSMQQDQP